MEGGKTRAVASVLSASATLKPAPTEADFFFFRTPSLSCLFKSRCTYTVSFLRLQIWL